MFRVFENGKPCTANFHNVHPSWNNADFTTLRSAAEYLDHWLGDFGTRGIAVEFLMHHELVWLHDIPFCIIEI